MRPCGWRRRVLVPVPGEQQRHVFERDRRPRFTQCGADHQRVPGRTVFEHERAQPGQRRHALKRRRRRARPLVPRSGHGLPPVRPAPGRSVLAQLEDVEVLLVDLEVRPPEPIRSVVAELEPGPPGRPRADRVQPWRPHVGNHPRPRHRHRQMRVVRQDRRAPVALRPGAITHALLPCCASGSAHRPLPRPPLRPRKRQRRPTAGPAARVCEGCSRAHRAHPAHATDRADRAAHQRIEASAPGAASTRPAHLRTARWAPPESRIGSGRPPTTAPAACPAP